MRVTQYRSGTNTLGIVFFCLVFGTFLGTLGEKGQIVIDFFKAVFEVIMRMVSTVMWWAEGKRKMKKRKEILQYWAGRKGNTRDGLLIWSKRAQDDTCGHHLRDSWENIGRRRLGVGDVAARLVHRHDRDRCVFLSAGDHAADLFGLREKEPL